MHVFAFRLAAQNAYSYFVDFGQTKVFMELCIFDGSKIFPKYAFFRGKMHVFLLFGWLQKMHTSLICRNRGMYFTKKVQICILKNACCPKMQIENAYFLRAIFTAIRKCIMDSGTPTFLICTLSPKFLW